MVKWHQERFNCGCAVQSAEIEGGILRRFCGRLPGSYLRKIVRKAASRSGSAVDCRAAVCGRALDAFWRGGDGRMMEKMPVGVEGFADIRTHGFYYVDKTMFIAELLRNWGKVNLFTRPRRFGKTLMMDMYVPKNGEVIEG